MTVTELNGWDYIGYLSIPSIGLELPVLSQWSYAGLKIAPGLSLIHISASIASSILP